MTNKLQFDYRAVLVQTVRDLDEEQRRQLFFLCRDPRRVLDVWELLTLLEDSAKISWIDVSFLKNCLHIVGRKDLVVALTKFEMKRELSILLNFYVKEKNGLHPFYPSSATVAAFHLVRLMERFPGREDLTGMMRSSDKKAEDLWLQFLSATPRTSRMTWGKFSMLVAIAGEIIAKTSLDHYARSSDEAIMEMCITLADKLSTILVELGCWEDFCTDVKKRAQRIFGEDANIPPFSGFRKQLANTIQELEKSIFF